MSNTLAIARKELGGYFTSPIGLVMIGFFALIYGYFYAAMLESFQRQAMQFGLAQAPVDLNEQMIRPLFSNVMVIMLFTFPLITMRTYAEEKRSGTMELLLTSPLTDWEIVAGKFLGAMGLIAAMLLVTIPHIGLLFYYATPELKPILTTYLGFFLMAGCFVAVGLFVSSVTRNQIVAGMATFAVFLMLWVIGWMVDFTTNPTARALLEYLSITQHFEDFTRGVLDTKHLVYYGSVIIFGLVLTMRSVETERWRG
jgi:ABC-2 type transport system permease protein